MRTLALLCGLALAAAPSFADTIHTADGKTITDCTIVTEGIDKVTYKSGRNEREIDAQDVISIEYSKKPRALSEADGPLMDGDLETASIILNDYVGAIVSGASDERKYKWAPAHAAWRVVELRQAMGDLEGVATAASRIIANFSDTRYLPGAYLAKADAFYWNDNAKGAQDTLKAFDSAITSAGLPERWRMECDLALVLTNDQLGATTRRLNLEEIADRAGSRFATVKNRALVAKGESYLQEILGSPKKATKNVPAALADFEAVLKDPKADDTTLAGAYVGLGDCIFHSAAKSKDRAELKRALLAYLRVAAVYPEQGRYVAKALFYAGRSFDLMGDEESMERAKIMYNQVGVKYPGSNWAKEARNFLR
ncbi:MAG: hypothetical protein ACJAZ8_002437 [Planctomycetota bacterium]|jgi:hypothetical protein